MHNKVVLWPKKTKKHEFSHYFLSQDVFFLHFAFLQLYKNHCSEINFIKKKTSLAMYCYVNNSTLKPSHKKIVISCNIFCSCKFRFIILSLPDICLVTYRNVEKKMFKTLPSLLSLKMIFSIGSLVY